jgi:hypothetical protein
MFLNHVYKIIILPTLVITYKNPQFRNIFILPTEFNRWWKFRIETDYVYALISEKNPLEEVNFQNLLKIL